MSNDDSIIVRCTVCSHEWDLDCDPPPCQHGAEVWILVSVYGEPA